MYSKAEITKFIQTYGALILAVYAIIQVWAIAFWKRYLSKGKLTIFETGWIDVGLGAFGPTMTLTGTFRAQRKDMFVRKVDVRVVREEDGASFDLEWLAFRAAQIKVGDPTATTFEVPSGINVPASQPKRYSIAFCERSTQNQLNRELILVTQEWRQFLAKKQESIQRALKQSSEAEVVERLFQEFLATPVPQSALKSISNSNWLKTGNYRITMQARTASPDKTYSKEWPCSIDDQLRLGLEGNSVATLKELLLGKLEYFYASLEYL